MNQQHIIPRHGVALLQALQFSAPGMELLRELDEKEWSDLLALCDRVQLTLLIGYLCRSALPPRVQARIQRNYQDNEQRQERIHSRILEIQWAFKQAGIDFTLLKGMGHSPTFTPDERLRAQFDIDLWCQPTEIPKAQSVMSQLGYKPFGKSKGRHLDPLIREASWNWRGDYYASDLPLPVDLHYRLWDTKLERVPGLREQDIWSRRREISFGGHTIRILDPVDTLAFAALHFLMHLLHGDTRLQRAWELAYFLHTHATEDAFWVRWHALYPAPVRQLQATVLRLVSIWFSAQMPPALMDEALRLPCDIQLWLKHYSYSPIRSLFSPNKDEIWLHLCFVSSWRDKLAILLRRLFPLRAALGAFPSSSNAGFRLDPAGIAVIRQRGVHHLRAFATTCVSAGQWLRLRQTL